MKILSATQTQKAEAFTIANESISGIDLMERASRQLYFWFDENVSRDLPIYIYCGKGNNGGDGLALSRMLLCAGWDVVTVIIQFSENASEDFTLNLERLKKVSSILVEVQSLEDMPPLPYEAVVVDAILGSGLNKPLHGLIADVVEVLNGGYNAIISIDIPTGLFSNENQGSLLRKVIDANVTLTFQFPFLSFMFPETGSLVGQFEVLDIGLSQEFLDSLVCQYHFVTLPEIEWLFSPKKKIDYKGTCGHAVIIGGSKGKMGAVTLSSRACLKSGAGLVTAGVPSEGMPVIQNTVPEIMAVDIMNMEIDSKLTYAFGPGLGTNKLTSDRLIELLKQINTPVILDADALNILSANTLWRHVPNNSILTPHMGELARMVGVQDSGLEYLNATQTFADKYGLFIVVKGPHTAIVSPNAETQFNSTGNQGMGTAGSGDVLTGMVASFLAQGYEPRNAAILGVYFHGLSGDIAALENGFSGLIASDIINHIPSAIKSFEG